MKKCGAYIRVSKGELQQGTSLINQKEFLLQQAKHDNLEIVEFYIDTKTGTTRKRPEFQRMIRDAEAKKFDILITKAGSRLARNVGLAYELKDLAESLNIDLIAYDGTINTLTGETFRFGLDAWQNEIEAENASQRIKAALKTRAINGKFNGSVAPYGYLSEKGKLIIRNDDTPQIVQYIFDEYIKGKGIDAIAHSLSKAGVPTPSMVANKDNAGYLWHGTTIRKILSNEVYIGNMVQMKERTKNAISEKRVKSQESDKVRVENTHEAIISKEDFTIVQELMITRSRNSTHQATHLFTNIAFCADCGKGMHFKKNSKGYVCGGFNKHSTIACTPHRIRETELANKILEDINILVNSASSLKNNTINFNEKLNKAQLKLEVKIKSLEKKLENQESIEFNTYKKYALGELSKDKYELFTEKLNKETLYLKTELTTCRDSLYKLKNVSISEVISSLKHAPTTITSLTSEILNKFIKRIEISENGDAKIFYRFSTPNISA